MYMYVKVWIFCACQVPECRPVTAVAVVRGFMSSTPAVHFVGRDGRPLFALVVNGMQITLWSIVCKLISITVYY